MRYLLDTNICIYSIARRPPGVVARLSELRQGEAGVSSVTVYELWYGIHKSAHVKKNSAALRQFLSPLAVLTFDAKDAEQCGHLRAQLERRGLPIGPYDLQIAAQAKAHGLVLVTHNTREFSRIQGLQVEDWAAVGDAGPA